MEENDSMCAHAEYVTSQVISVVTNLLK